MSRRSTIVNGQFLLDQFSGAAAAYSLRRLRNAYTGNCIRVRRSSDNAELDIGFTPTGVLDTVALLAHVGAGDGFVTTWYDQSGSSRNATQATLTAQPQIVSSGVINVSNGNNCFITDGINDQLIINYNIPTPFSIIGVSRINSGTNTQTSIGNLTNTGNNEGFVWSTTLSPTNSILSGARVGATTFLTSAVNVGNLIYLNFSTYLVNTITAYVNGNNGNSVNATYNIRDTNITIGSGRTGETSLFRRPLSFFEVIIYPSDQSSNRTAIENNIMKCYGI
jgi:hypothetical protein